MLKVKNISYSIGAKKILDNVSAEFLPENMNVILGPNGSGKSTFLKILSGELKPIDGKVLYNNKNVADINKTTLAKHRAMMNQQTELNFSLTVEEVVMMGRYPHYTINPNKKDKLICAEVLDKMNLSSFIDRNYLTLSGGEKQRVQYARVLAQIWSFSDEPKYLFLDEPLNNLDIKYQQEFLEIAKRFTQNNTTVIAIIHDINLAIQYASNLFFFKDGKLVSQGNPHSIVSEELIKNVFDVEVNIVRNQEQQLPIITFKKNEQTI